MRDLVAELSRIELPASAAEVGIGRSLALRRAWPRAAGELALEYRGAEDGGSRVLVGAVWAAEGGHASTGTPLAVPVAGGILALFAGGADPELPGLRQVLAEPGAELIAHRARRRAVVRVGSAYAKVVRPARAERTVGALRAAAAVAAPVAVPRVLAVDADAGVVRLEALEGVPFVEAIAARDAAEVGARVGASLRALHAAPAALAVAVHTAREEREVLSGWLRDLEWLRPDLARLARERAEPVLAALADADAAVEGVLHRDLHDGQLLLGADGAVGVLDFDTLARGEPALDVANLLVHLEFARLRGSAPAGALERAADALLGAYDPPLSTAARLRVYADAARVRLACVHAFRPAREEVVRAMLERAGL